jgi:branched-chain amino acid transport system substrate-binding protein
MKRLTVLFLFLCATCCWAAEPIVIGQSLGLSPPDRQAQEVQAGTAAFVEAVNARGGIGGRRLRVVTMDDGNVPERHQQNLRTLVKVEHAVAIVNCIGEAICRAAAVTAGELHVPLIGVQTGSLAISHLAGGYVFRIRPAWDREAETLMVQLKALSVSRAVLVTEQRTETEPIKLLRNAATRHGVALQTVPLSSLTTEGYKQLMNTLAQGGFQAAVLELQPETIEAIRAAGIDARAEWPAVLMAMSSVSLGHLRTGFEKRVIGFTALVPNPEKTSVRLTAELERSADAHAMGGGSMALTHAGLEAYIGLKVLGEALRRSNGRIDPARIVAALEGLNGVDLGGYVVSFNRGRTSGSDFVEMAFRTRSGTIR